VWTGLERTQLQAGTVVPLGEELNKDSVPLQGQSLSNICAV